MLEIPSEFLNQFWPVFDKFDGGITPLSHLLDGTPPPQNSPRNESAVVYSMPSKEGQV